MTHEVENLVVVSDTHCGCKLGLCPPSGAQLDDGGSYAPSELQRKMHAWWDEFWREFVPSVVKRSPFAVVHAGDAIDGVHHNSVTQISHNLQDQCQIAYSLLAPIVDRCKGRYYHIRGTEAHVGQSAQEEERLAQRLGAIPNNQGQHARYELWHRLGLGLIHVMHHIGATGSQAYEATAVHKELIESFVEASRWSEQPPSVIVRGHRHRNIEITIPAELAGYSQARAVVAPGWQAKTPFMWKIAGARLSSPQFGGLVIRKHVDGVVYIRSFVRHLKRSSPEPS